MNVCEKQRVRVPPGGQHWTLSPFFLNSTVLKFKLVKLQCLVVLIVQCAAAGTVKKGIVSPAWTIVVMMNSGEYQADGCCPDLERNNQDSIFLEKIECAFMTELCLSPFSSRMAVQFLKSRLSQEGASITFKRVIGFILDIVNKTSHKNEKIIDSSINWQSGCPNVIKDLRACPLWNTAEFPWIKNLEEASSSICTELVGLRGLHSFQPYRAPVVVSAPSSSSQPPNINDAVASDSLGALATTSGEWNVCYLHLHDIDVGDTLKRCPLTAAAIE